MILPDRGFMADAEYFSVVAHNARTPAERINLLAVSREYRRLANLGQPYITEARADLWRKRAEECRTLAETFKTPACIEQLTRLANAYDLMAASNEWKP